MKTKKVLAALAATALVAALAVPGVALATGNVGDQHRAQGAYPAPETCAAQGNCAGQNAFIDEDGNGICDNQGARASFIDEDGDGICDNRADACPNGQGAGQGYGSSTCNGTGQHLRAHDGTGNGTGAGTGCGTGNCDSAGSCDGTGNGADAGTGHGFHARNCR